MKYFNKARALAVFILIFPAVGLGQTLSADYLAYIERYKDVAVRHRQEYGIPASITLAQGLLESAAGRSRLATEGNNHFGIKCHKDWKGEGVYADDDRRNECFRKYADAAESFEDHARFLKRRRYEPLFRLKDTDYKGWANGLRQCGYATDPSYAAKLVNIIELYGLDRFDKGSVPAGKRKELAGDETLEHSIDMDIVGEFVMMHKIRQRWGLYCVEAYAGDTYEGIAREMGMKKKKLTGYNDLKKNAADVLQAGDVVWLQEKRERTEEGMPAVHAVESGDTPYSVAQRYGLRLKSLLKLNKLKANSTLKPGDELRLR